MTDLRHSERNALPEFLRGEYSPPAVATLVAGRRRWFYERLESWSPPDGWEEGPSILDFPVYPSRRPGLTFRELGDALVIHDPMTLDAHSLNETAAALFELCDGSRDFREISSEYARRYGLEPSKADADARRLLKEFFEKKLLLARSEKVGPPNDGPVLPRRPLIPLRPTPPYPIPQPPPVRRSRAPLFGPGVGPTDPHNSNPSSLPAP